MVILAVGLMATALLMSNTYKFSVRSRYMSEAAQLASEKLEDLNRFSTVDEHITVMSGDDACGITGENCEGSITPAITCTSTTCTINALPTALGPTTITVGGSSYSVFYFDSVFLSAANGTLSETYQTAGGASPSYTTLSFTPQGLTPLPSSSTTAPTVGETFDRRWTIEMNQPLTGIRRITVLVTLLDATIFPPVTFQMSMVRP
jgi:hypothetical protein